MGHPAHYHNIKHVIDSLSDKGHKILLVARQKDVLFSLLEDVTYDIEFLGERKSKSKSGLISSVLGREFKMLKIFYPELNERFERCIKVVENEI